MQARAPEPLYSIGEEIAHTLTHAAGLVLSIGGLVGLVMVASLRGDAWHIVGCTIFGVTLMLLYLASTLYHGIPHRRVKQVLRRLDHAAIFLLIAGTYTPFTLVNLRGAWGWTLLALVWSLAVLGIVLQLTLPSKAPRLSVPLYLAMGWMVVVAFEPLAQSMQPAGLMLLFMGGIAYTLGVVFYAWERLPFNHAVWHLFVLAGSACHFSCIFGYVIPSPGP